MCCYLVAKHTVMTIPFEHYYTFFGRKFLRCFGQVMLQGNAITGLLFLLGIGLSSPIMLLGSIVATVSGLFMAQRCTFDSSGIELGLYGFNAALVGIAVFYFLSLSLTSLLFVIVGGFFSTLLTHLLRTRLVSLPALTTPFVVTTWLILLYADYLGLSTIVVSSPAVVDSISFVDYFLATMRGLAQVMLQDSWLCGVIFLCALAFNSAKAAIWALTGSAIGGLVAIAFSFSQEMVVLGIYGFNSCLVALALAVSYPQKYWLLMIAILVSVLLTRVFEEVSLPALTAPFILTTWLMMIFNKMVSHCSKVSEKGDCLR